MIHNAVYSMAETTEEITPLSVERIIDLIRTTRNELVKELLSGDVLDHYYEKKYSRALSNVKREFFKRDLRDLLIAPVDLVHYAKLINHIKETGTASLARENSRFFYDEVDNVISKY